KGSGLAVMNCVVQYFRSAEYLEKVIEGLLESVRDGGKIFIGDVRDLRLLPVFHLGIELGQSAGATVVDELNERVRKQMALEKELVLDPAFFVKLKQKSEGIGGVEVRLKRGRYQNELTQYRYDVVLEVGGSVVKSDEVNWRPWDEAALTIERLKEELSAKRPELIALAEIPNRRVKREANAVELMR